MNKAWHITLFLLTLNAAADGTPPESPVQCRHGLRNCTVTNIYGSFSDRNSHCNAAEAVFPATEHDLLTAVATAARRRQKMRVVSRYSNSIPSLVCPAGDDGLIISTHHLDRILDIDTANLTVTAEAGATLRQLLDAAAAAGMALPHTPYWDAVSLGGAISTGAHGSSLFGAGGALHEHLVELTLISPAPASAGYVRRTTVTAGSADFDAARVSLGLFGVIYSVKLQLQPIFKRSVVHVTAPDTDVAGILAKLARTHEFSDLSWFPAQKRVIYRADKRLPASVPGDAVYDFVGFRALPAALLRGFRVAEEAEEVAGDRRSRCECAAAETAALLEAKFGLRGGGAVGFQHMIQASGACTRSGDDRMLTACAWDPRVPGLFFYQTAVAVDLRHMPALVADIAALRDRSPRGALCAVETYGGILMRFLRRSSALLGAERDVVAVDVTYFRSRCTEPEGPASRMDEDVLEEIEQMLVVKYAGLPHWGKNRPVAFAGALSKYSGAAEFLRAKEKYDPQGLFSNEWTDRLLFGGPRSDGCAVEGDCVCQADPDCAPADGYVCRPGRVFAEARVCRRSC